MIASQRCCTQLSCRSAPPGPCLTPPLGGARRRGSRRRRGCAVGRRGARRPGACAARTRAARPGSGLCGRSAAAGGGGGSGGRGRAAGAGRRRVVAGGAAAGGGAGAARRRGRAGAGGRVCGAGRADAGRGARAGGRGARGRRALIQAATRLQRQLDAVQQLGRPVGVLGVLLRCWAQAGRPRPGSCGAAPQGVRARALRSGPGLPARPLRAELGLPVMTGKMFWGGCERDGTCGGCAGGAGGCMQGAVGKWTSGAGAHRLRL